MTDFNERFPSSRAAAVDVIANTGTSGLRRLVAIVEVMALALLIPVGVLLVGLPIAAAVRAALSVVLR